MKIYLEMVMESNIIVEIQLLCDRGLTSFCNDSEFFLSIVYSIVSLALYPVSSVTAPRQAITEVYERALFVQCSRMNVPISRTVTKEICHRQFMTQGKKTKTKGAQTCYCLSVSQS